VPRTQNESMINSRLKFAMLALAAAVVLGSSLYLFAREPVPAAPFSPPPPSTSSTQAKIAWSTTSIEVILSPGESTAKDLTFSSSLGLTNFTIEAVPQIASYLTVSCSRSYSWPKSGGTHCLLYSRECNSRYLFRHGSCERLKPDISADAKDNCECVAPSYERPVWLQSEVPTYLGYPTRFRFDDFQ